MIKFVKPENLNGEELLNELEEAGVVVQLDNFNKPASPFLDGNGELWLAIESKDKAKAEAVVASHNGTI